MSVVVSVANFGPIVRAEAELRPMTVLVGVNNTGKTYFATVLDRALRAVTSDSMFDDVQPSRLWESVGSVSHAYEPVTFSWDHIDDGEIQAILTKVLHSYSSLLLESVEYAFGVELSELARRSRKAGAGSAESDSCHIKVVNTQPAWSVSVHLLTREVTVAAPVVSEWREVVTTSQHGHKKAEFIWNALKGNLPRGLFEMFPAAMPGLFDEWPQSSVHLPAGRTGIMQSYEVIAGSVVRRSVEAGIRPMPSLPALPGTAADFLSLLLSLPRQGSRGRQESELADLVSKYEGCFDFAVETEGVEESDQLSVRTPEGSFPLSRTSSMVSELAPILMTVKSVLHSSDCIVIDEPEAHLHPGLQKEMARFLGELVNRGPKAVVTTHSDFFLGEINNLIRANALPSGPTAVTGLVGLKPTDVSALLFERSDDGCEAQQLTVDPVDGIDESTFGDVVEDLYRESMAISDAMHDKL